MSHHVNHLGGVWGKFINAQRPRNHISTSLKLVFVVEPFFFFIRLSSFRFHFKTYPRILFNGFYNNIIYIKYIRWVVYVVGRISNHFSINWWKSSSNAAAAIYLLPARFKWEIIFSTQYAKMISFVWLWKWEWLGVCRLQSKWTEDEQHLCKHHVGR